MTTADETTDHAEAPGAVDAPTPADPDGDATTTGPGGTKRRWPRWQAWLVLAVYLAYWVYLSWPLAEHLNTYFWGGVGDKTGFLSLYRELHQQGQLGILPGTIHDFAAPEGLRYGWVNLFSQASSSLFVSALFVLFSPLAATTVYSTVAVVGTAFATFLLARKLTGSALAAIVAGFVYGFAPFMMIKSTVHVDFSHGWVFVVMLWRWLELIERRTVRNAIFAGLASALVASWTAYFALLALVLGTVLALAFILHELRARGFGGVRRSVLLIAITAIAPVAFILLTLVLANNDPDAVLQPTRSIDELTTYAARPLEYLMPTGGTPFVGTWAETWRATHGHGSNGSENTLYLGWIALALALLGTLTLLRVRSTRFLAFTLVAIGLAAAWVSFPPLVAVGGTLIPTPSKWLFEVQPGFRVYSRFVVLVLMAVALLAAFGVRTLLRTVRRPPAQFALAALLAVAVSADLDYDLIPNPLEPFPSYEALKDQPPGIAAEFPLMPAAGDLNQATFYQQTHGKPVINGYREGTVQEARAVGLNDLSSKDAISGLRLLGVKYLLVRKDTAVVNWPTVPTPRAEDVTLLKKDPRMWLYRLNPGYGQTIYWSGTLYPVETGQYGKPLRWSGSDRAKLNLVTNCKTCRTGTVSFTAQSFGDNRTLVFSGAGIKDVRRTAEPVGKKITLPVQLVDGKAVIDVAITPGPVPVKQYVPDTPDARSLSAGFGDPTFKVDR